MIGSVTKIGVAIRPALVEGPVLLLGVDFALVNLVELFEGSALIPIAVGKLVKFAPPLLIVVPIVVSSCEAASVRLTALARLP